MKRTISLLLVFSMLMSFGGNVFAASPDVGTGLPENVCVIDGGYAYSEFTDDYSIVILTEDATQYVSGSIIYSSAPDDAYQFMIPNWAASEYAPTSAAFWTSVVDYMEANLNEADLIVFNTDEITTYSSAIADLTPQLQALEGTGYSKTLKSVASYQGQTFRIYEEKSVDVYRTDQHHAWSAAISIATLIAKLALKSSSTLVKTIGLLFGITAAVASSMLPANGNVYYYIGRAWSTRYTTINGSTYVYNIAEKIIYYSGFEDTSMNNTDRAELTPEPYDKVFTKDSEAYYNSFAQQREDAYAMFLKVGQQA